MIDKKRRGGSKRRTTKDRVLQARIPEQLDEELRDRAEQMGLSVSTIVRNVLLHTFDLVEGVVTDSAQVAKALQGRAVSSSDVPRVPNAPQAVIGWQEAVLNLNGICDECNAILPRGERAAVGVPTQPRPALLCLECLQALSVHPSHQEEEAKPAAKASRRGRKAVK